jgi:circadian clock protein KaiC
MMESVPDSPPTDLSTGLADAQTGTNGLDDVLGGGLTRNRLYVVEGVPGSGKTTLALRFLTEGARTGERVLYITLSETEEELRAAARSHGWSLDGVTIRQIAPAPDSLQPGSQYTMFHPSEVELGETIRVVLAEVERTKPARVVIDSLSELRLLAGNALRYRRQILVLKQFFSGQQCTVLLLDDLTASDRDLQVQSIAHGVVHLEHIASDFGSERRRLRVIKYRGRAYRAGYHDFLILKGGLQVFPRLVASEHRQVRVQERLPSGVAALDALLGGGIDAGTSMLIVGAAGVGKSTLASLFVSAAAARGQSSAMFLFDESIQTLLSRSAGLGIGLEEQVGTGRVRLQPVDPAELSPGEFAHSIRQAVEDQGARIVVIDSLNGYLNAMPEERFLVMQLHELLSYLGQQGVATVIIGAHQGLIGSQMTTPMDASYLADAVLLLRYFEAGGEVRQAISVMKKRGGEHERTIREFRLANGAIEVGEPLRKFRGVLTGVPQYEAGDAPPVRK